jgi:hypothetical protein
MDSVQLSGLSCRASSLMHAQLGNRMANFRPSSTPKPPELEPKELAALRDVSQHHSVEVPLLRRLEKLGFIEQKSGTWSTTQQGHIFLMFRAAK